MKKSNFIKDALILFVITLILGIALSFVEQITEGPIYLANNKALIESYKKVLSGYESGEDITDSIKDKINKDKSNPANLDSILIAKDSSNNQVGYLVTTTVKGFGGNIKVVVGFDNDLKIKGISYPETLSETAGIGMKVTDDNEFGKYYIDKTGDDIKNGHTITGASISSTAVRNALALSFDSANSAKGGK